MLTITRVAGSIEDDAGADSEPRSADPSAPTLDAAPMRVKRKR